MAFSTASAPVVRNMVFLGLAPGASAFKLLGEGDVALVRSHLKAGMYELFQLPRDRLLHLRVHVAGVEYRDAAGEIDIAPALDVPDLGVGGTLGVHRERVGDAAGHGLLAAGMQFGVRRQGGSPCKTQAKLWRVSGSDRRRRPLAA